MQTSLRRKREPSLALNLPCPNHADPAHRARVALRRPRSCRPSWFGSDHRVGVSDAHPTLSPTLFLTLTCTCLLDACSSRSFYATDAGRQHFADQLTSIRCAARPSCRCLPRLIPLHAHPPRSCVCAGTASRRRAWPSRFEPHPLNPQVWVFSVSRFPLSCADLQLRYALRLPDLRKL